MQTVCCYCDLIICPGVILIFYLTRVLVKHRHSGGNLKLQFLFFLSEQDGYEYCLSVGLIAVTQARRTVPVNTFRETKQNTFVVNVIFLRETTIKVSLISRATAFFQERQNPLNQRVQQKYFINRSVVDGSRVRKKNYGKQHDVSQKFCPLITQCSS